jgi:2-isopropylmalate synthase
MTRCSPAVLNAGTAAVCLVGKTHDFHVTEALGITLDENVENIAASVAHLVAKGREALFDAEHFFDGYKANPDYALTCLRPRMTPARAGSCCATPMAARCPGRSGASRARSSRRASRASGWASTPITTPKPPWRAALRRSRPGARQVQGTLNGLGERCGNANLTSLIPTLLLKEPWASRFETGIARTRWRI